MAVEKIIIAELDLNTTKLIAAAARTSKEIDKLILKQKELKKSTTTNREEFVKNTIQLKKTRAEFLAQQKAIIALERPYSKLSNQLIRARGKAKDLAAEFGVNSRQARAAAVGVNKLDSRLKRIDKSLGQSQRNVGNYGASIKNLALRFIGLTTVIFGAIRVLRRSIGIFTNFEKKNAELSAILQIEKNQMGALEAESKRLGATTAKTATEIVGLQIAFARLGFSQKQIIDLTEATINGSIAMNAELDKTALLVGAVVNTFDDFSSIDAPEIIDILSLSTAKSALNFEKLEKGIPIVAGAAEAAGVPFTTLIALMGKLADSGIDVSTSSTAIRNIFIKSAAAGDNFGDILERIKGSQDKLTASVDVFGVRAAVSATILSKNIDATKELSIQLDNATGTAQEMARKGLDTLSGSGTLFLSAWQGLILGLENGQGVFAKTLRSIVDFGTSLLNSLTPQEDFVQNIIDEQTELNILFSKLTDVNTSQEDRNGLIATLQEQYPDFIKNIDLEKTSSEELSGILETINDQFINRIILQKLIDKATEVGNVIADRQISLNEGQADALLTLVEAERSLGIEVDLSKTRLERRDIALKEANKQTGFFKIEANNTQRSLALLNEEFLGGVGLRNEEIDNKTLQLKGMREEIEKFKTENGLIKIEVKVIPEPDKPIVPTLTEDEKDDAKKQREKDAKDSDDFFAGEADKRLKAEQDFEQQRRLLQNEIDLQNAETAEDKAVVKAEQDLIKQELRLEKLELNEEEFNELDKLIKEAHLLETDDIETKFRKKREADQALADKKELADKKRQNAKILNEAINLVGQQTRLGQALVVIKGVLAAKESLIELGLLKQKVVATTAGVAVDQAKGLSKTASVGFPQNIPLIIAFIAQFAGIISALKGAAGAAKNVSVPKFYEGGVIGGSANIPVSMRNQGGDDVLIQAKRGEVILNQDQQQRAGGSAFFKSIGVPSFVHGGQIASASIPLTQSQAVNFDELGDILSERINAVKIVAIESEITDAQFTQVEIVEGARI